MGWLVAVILLAGVHFNGSAQALRIMALGNSLTVGENGEPNPDLQLPPEQLVGYRYGLKYLLQQAGYSVDFVGSQSNGSVFFSDCQHAGIGGSRDQYVERLLKDGYDERNGVQILNPPRYYLDEYNPDIILLHVGTNDVTHEEDLITNQRVSAILDLIDQYEIRADKEVTVFLALIINRRLPCIAGSGCQTTRNWNAFLESMAQTRINNGDKIVIVDMENDAGIVYTNEDFYANDPEGIHLNSNGYGKMAALWYDKIVSNVNTAPVIDPIPDQSVGDGDPFSVIDLDNYVYDIEDSDADLTWTVSHLSTANLQVVIDENRQATVTPVSPTWIGEESLIFTVTDRGVNGSFQKSDADTVVFTVSSQNDLPVITGQSDLSTTEDMSFALSLSDFTVYDPDPDQSPEDQTLNVLNGNHYSVSGYTVTPEANYDSDLYVNVSVSDLVGPGPVYQALVQITPVNDPPVFVSQSEISFNEDESFTMSVNYLNVYDVDNDLSELQCMMQPGANHSIDGQVIIPNPDYNGMLYIETYIEDPSGARSSTFNLVVTVNPVSDPPKFTTEPEDTAIVNESYIYPFKAVDGDGVEMNYQILQIPDWIEYYSNSHALVGVPSTEDLGYTEIKIRASNGVDIVNQSFYLHVIMGTSATERIPLNGQPCIYPNPSSGSFSIHYENQKDPGVFRLYDGLGKAMAEEKLFPGENTNFLSGKLNLYPGVYIYTIRAGTEYFTGKLVIQSQ